MSFNSNFYNLYGNTFQNPQTFMSSPPVGLLAQTLLPSDITDENVIKHFESKLPKIQQIKAQNSISISQVHNQICNLALALNEIKSKQRLLIEKMNNLSDDEWNVHLKQTEDNKTVISKILSNINNMNIDILRKLLTKRCSKRARQKRQRIEKSKRKEELKKQNEEKSRKIDEYLKKFQDDMNKAKQEEATKLQIDAVLKETIRKKQDAKRYIVKLDALVKLRKARMNTAKGRGEAVSQKEADVFEINIEKLKSMWLQRLIIYKKEEADLHAKLQQDCEGMTEKNETEKEVKHSLELWRGVLFGERMPQVNFTDVYTFLAVRSQWDQYLNVEGSSIPIGWVPPTAKK